MNVYERLKQENGYISALAPMEGVTDTTFRQVLVDIGKPDLFFTEFLSVEGFCSKGRERVSHRLEFVDSERPVVVQLWGNVPEYYAETVKYVKTLNPDGIDINIGCSVRDVLASGKGSALILEQNLVKEIIEAVTSEAGDIPVSVKTRLGYDKVDVEGWIAFLLGQKLDMVTIHGRISKEGYATQSRWEELKQCVQLRDEISPDTILIGNGDISSFEQGKNYVQEYGLDGFMVGRAILNNPWLFSGRDDIPVQERISTLLKHLELFEKIWGDTKPFNSQKKYIKAYINNFDGANEVRKALMECSGYEEVQRVVSELI